MSDLPARFYRPTRNITEADEAEIIAAYTFRPVNAVQNDSESTEDFEDDPNDYPWESDEDVIYHDESWSFDKLK